MLCDFKVMGKENYLQINEQGTLKKLPKLPWYWQLFFIVKNRIKGKLDSKEIERVAKRYDEKKI